MSRSTGQTLVLGLLALALLIPIGVIAVVEVSQNRSLDEPQALVALAGAVVAFFYGHGSFLASVDAQAGATNAALGIVQAIQPPRSGGRRGDAAPTPSETFGRRTGTSSETPSEPAAGPSPRSAWTSPQDSQTTGRT